MVHKVKAMITSTATGYRWRGKRFSKTPAGLRLLRVAVAEAGLTQLVFVERRGHKHRHE